jgi:hypothetical protein
MHNVQSTATRNRFGAHDTLPSVSEYAMKLQTPPPFCRQFFPPPLLVRTVPCKSAQHRLQLSSAVAACEVGEPKRVRLLDLHGKISGGEGAATPPARRICLPRAMCPPAQRPTPCCTVMTRARSMT